MGGGAEDFITDLVLSVLRCILMRLYYVLVIPTVKRILLNH